jgi:hypothetical protein
VDKLAEIRLGTSSFTAAGWEGAFYPTWIKPFFSLSYRSGVDPKFAASILATRRLANWDEKPSPISDAIILAEGIMQRINARWAPTPPPTTAGRAEHHEHFR